MPFSIPQMAAELGLKPYHVAYHLDEAGIKSIGEVCGHKVYSRQQLESLRKHVAQHSYLIKRDRQKQSKAEPANA
jgi:hypothetical protein